MKYYGVLSCVSDKLGCVAGEGSLRNTVLDSTQKIGVSGENTVIGLSHYFTFLQTCLFIPKFRSKLKYYIEVLLSVYILKYSSICSATSQCSHFHLLVLFSFLAEHNLHCPFGIAFPLVLGICHGKCAQYPACSLPSESAEG
jgi:hypothetical protein